MKRNWELIKRILEGIEGLELGDVLRAGDVEGFCPEEVSCHMLLLKEAGLIEAVCRGEGPGKKPECVAWRLTWQGYELLDVLRSKSLWKRLKEYLGKAGVEVSFCAVKVLSEKFLSEL
jgi:hypothetical protein